ncbi:helix-turn-helix domain-containing protein [Paenibacillus sp. SN-8-1]|uniref:helix-turn-helix domain-containing protein n=1 Tax=Paenibacillus sp. SN-8-1 TaxID=3435409 RepID=UPI003D9AB00E
MDSIGARIKYIRKLHELNQVSFAQAIGISQGTLSELESNKFSPSVETLIQLHQKFEVDYIGFY